MAIRPQSSTKARLRAQCQRGKHPRAYIKKDWNRKGQEFRECDACNAFLGFTGRKRGKA